MRDTYITDLILLDLYYPNNIWQKVQIMKLIINFLKNWITSSKRLKYALQPVLKYVFSLMIRDHISSYVKSGMNYKDNYEFERTCKEVVLGLLQSNQIISTRIISLSA